MRYPALFAILVLLPFASLSSFAQKSSGSVAGSKTRGDTTLAISDFEQAIEVIATSTDSGAVHAADSKLRSGGLPAIQALVKHLTDSREAPSRYLTRAVAGEPDMGDHSFWLIQDILESHTSKQDALYSPLEKESVAKWLAVRDGLSLAHLRREACIGAFEKIFAMSKEYPEFDANPVIRDYAERLVKLNKAIYAEGK